MARIGPKRAKRNDDVVTATNGQGVRTGGREVRFRAVTKRFLTPEAEDFTAVDSVDFTVPAGEFVCILGPSGHGKTTMMNLLAGFITPTSGHIDVDGVEVTGPGPDRGVVFQRDTLLLWRSVAANLTFGLAAQGMPRSERDAVAEHLLKITGLEGMGRHWPKQLSGGMRRRVAIAAVLANKPDVLIMDEPFTGLDTVRRSALYQVLLDLWAEVRSTVLCITHDVDEALILADRILIIVNGAVVFDHPVPSPRPRSIEVLNSAEMGQLRIRIMRQLEKGVTGVE